MQEEWLERARFWLLLFDNIIYYDRFFKLFMETINRLNKTIIAKTNKSFKQKKKWMHESVAELSPIVFCVVMNQVSGMYQILRA